MVTPAASGPEIHSSVCPVSSLTSRKFVDDATVATLSYTPPVPAVGDNSFARHQTADPAPFAELVPREHEAAASRKYIVVI